MEKAMSRSNRLDVSGATAAEAADTSARAGRAVSAQDSRADADSFMVEGEVLDVLDGYGLAHVRAADGSTYGLTRQTPGIQFADVREGQHVRVEVTRKFNRVTHAQLLGESSPRTSSGGDEDCGACR